MVARNPRYANPAANTPPPEPGGGPVTAAERRVAALLTRALHPSTPPAEASACRERLAAIRQRGPVWVPVDGVPGLAIDLAGITVTVGGEVR